AAFGEQIKRGVEQAVADINAKGGLLGEKLVTTIGDDRSDPKDGVSVANKFVSEEVTYVVGHFNSGVTIPASKEYADGNIMMVTPAATNPRLTDDGKWNVFRTCGRDDQQGIVAGNYILKNFKDKKVAVIHDKTPYGKGLADETKKVLNAGGLTEVIYDGITVGEKDYSALISRLKQLNVDYVYFGGLYAEAGLIIRQMRDQGVMATMISGDGVVASEFASVAGPGIEGTLITFGPDPRKTPTAASVVKEFTAKGVDPEGYVLYAYAATQVIAQGIEGAKTKDPKEVAKYLRTGVELSTVMGPLSYDEKGDMKQLAYVLYRWVKDENGKMVYREIEEAKSN
ncbi:MAG: branched-chain amino acid ABC transporter substrate-binding protein, partial [Pseudomonadota bacterium]